MGAERPVSSPTSTPDSMSNILSNFNPADYRAESSSSSTQSTEKDRFEDLEVEDFLKLMIAELQNQDPLNPMDNKDMLNQINQMRQIVSNDKLTSSLEAIMLGQSVATASNLLGKTVTGTNQLGDRTSGVVDRVVFEEGKPKIYVGAHILDLESITEIIPTATDEKESSQSESENSPTEEDES